jgi:hypothetical protein
MTRLPTHRRKERDASGKVTRTRPLFPYPQVAKYKGSFQARHRQQVKSDAAPDEAWETFHLRFYKDVAPNGADACGTRRATPVRVSMDHPGWCLPGSPRDSLKHFRRRFEEQITRRPQVWTGALNHEDGHHPIGGVHR